MRPRWRRAVSAGGVTVIVAMVALPGLFRHALPMPQTVSGPPHHFTSTSRPNGPVRSGAPQFNNTNVFNWNPQVAVTRSSPQPRSATQASRVRQEHSNGAADLAARFPSLAHQVFISAPQNGSEPDYFAWLGNLLNGTPMPAGKSQIPAAADHLAHAQADLDRNDLAGAVAEVRRISGPAATIMYPWLAEAESHLAQNHPQERMNTRVAQNAQPRRTWPNVMPSEIPPYARESTGPSSR